MSENKTGAVAWWFGGLILFASSGMLFAYETRWTDQRIDKATEDSAEFKVDGEIFAGYENVDRQTSGQIDSSGTTGSPIVGQNMNQGFTISRAQVNFKGLMIDGPYKGFGFRVSMDAGRNINDENGTPNSLTTTGNNAQIAELKVAYLIAPLYDFGSKIGKAELRFGQQQQPIIDGQAGFSSEGVWGYRFVEASVPDKLKMAVFADRGLSYIHRSDYFGVQLFLSNGEGHRRTNAQALQVQQNIAGCVIPAAVSAPTYGAQNVVIGSGVGVSGCAINNTVISNSAALTAQQAAIAQQNLQRLSSGTVDGTALGTDSYGLDFSGVPAIFPTGTSKDFAVKIAFPFRLTNVIGEKSQEYKYAAANLTNPAGGLFDYYQGGADAKKKKIYGEEATVQFNPGFAEFTLGGGHFVYDDTRSTSIRIDQNGFAEALATPYAGNPIPNFTSQINVEGSRWGQANYGYITAKFKTQAGKFGFIFRDTFGTGNGGGSGSSGVLQALPSKSVMQQMVEAASQQPFTSGTFTIQNNIQQAIVNLRGSTPVVDLGKARFNDAVYGVSYEPMDRMRFVIGISTHTSTDPDGERSKANRLQQYAGLGTGNVGTQANQLVQGSTGAPFVVNDFGGALQENRQVFLRALYSF